MQKDILRFIMEIEEKKKMIRGGYYHAQGIEGMDKSRFRFL